MTKAYLAGFIAASQGKWLDKCPFENQNSIAYKEWLAGNGDYWSVAGGCEGVGEEKVE